MRTRILNNAYCKVILCAFLSLTNCDKEVYYDIPKESWPNFDDGSKRIFKSTSAPADTFLIKIRLDYRLSDKHNNYQQIYVNYHRIKQNNQESAAFVSILQNNTGVYVMNRSNPLSSVRTLDTYQLINGEEINTVLVKNSPDQYVQEIKELYYHVQFGLVKYVLKDGTTYDLDP
jgi:hypothetical protein